MLDGADLTVSEPSRGNIKFVKFQKFEASVFKTKEPTPQALIEEEAPAR